MHLATMNEIWPILYLRSPLFQTSGLRSQKGNIVNHLFVHFFRHGVGFVDHRHHLNQFLLEQYVVCKNGVKCNKKVQASIQLTEQ